MPFDILHMDEKAIQYFDDGEELCNRIDDVIKKFKQCEKDILDNKAFLIRKRRTYIGSRFFLVVGLAILGLSPVSMILMSAYGFPFIVFVLPLALAFGYYVRWKYIKNVLPVYENIYGKYIAEEQEWMKELAEELYADRNQYEEVLHLIPDNMRHPAAMTILKESVQTGYADNLKNALTFYKERYAIIRKEKTEEASRLKHEIECSEEKSVARVNFMMSLEDIVAPYIA